MTPISRLACASLLLLAACSPAPKEDSDAKATATVKTAAATLSDVPEVLTAYGDAEVAASGERTLSAPIEAIVANVRVAPGDHVQAGQVLVDLKASPASQADLTKSVGDLDVASKAYARAERLRASGLASDADLETARAAQVMAVQAHQSLEARFRAGLSVRAPEAGVVETLTATPGDLIAAGASLGKVGSSSAMKVRLGLEAADIRRVRVGDQVSLRPPGGAVFATGAVASIQPRLDPQTRLAGVLVDAQGGSVLGQNVQGDIVLQTLHLPTVPRRAVVYEQDQAEVFIVSGGLAHRKPVSLGPTRDDVVAVRSGLNAGDRVVTDGAAALDDGMAVSEAGKP